MAMERRSQRLGEMRWSADATNSRASPTGHPLLALLLTEVESVVAEGLRLAETPMLHKLPLVTSRADLNAPKARAQPQTPDILRTRRLPTLWGGEATFVALGRASSSGKIYFDNLARLSII